MCTYVTRGQRTEANGEDWLSCARIKIMTPHDDDQETLDPEDETAIEEAIAYVEAGGELVDGPAFMAEWRERLEAKWRARTG
jgi:hypothetical protein